MTFRFPSVLILGFVLIQGCSSTKESGVEDSQQTAAVDKASRNAALQHFVDGSVAEMKGDYANAILDYQDALRYDKNDAVYFALAKCYAALQKHSLAIEAGNEAVRLAPDNLEYRKTLAEICVAAFQIDAATQHYEEIVKRDSTSLEAYYGLANLYAGRKPLKALETYYKIIDRFGPEWNVLLQIAELENSLGQFGKAAAALQQLLEIDPGNLELRHSVAQAYIRAENYDTALVILKDLRSMRPDNLAYAADLAGIYLHQKEYTKAASEIEPIIANDSVGLDVKLRLGEMYFARLEQDSTLAPVARDVFERIHASHPEDWRPYWFLGAIGAITNNDSLSESNFRKVTELAAWNADAWVYLSSVFMEQNNYTEVITVLESALRVVPDDFRVTFLLGVAYSRSERTSDAIRTLEIARKINPKDVNCIMQLALVYDGLKNSEETDKLYEEALALEPENHLVLNNYSYSLAERNMQIERAFEMAQKAVKAQPENTSYLDTIGWVYFRMGEYERAEQYVRQAIEKGGANAILYEHLGDIYFMMKDRDRALEQWNLALKLDASNSALKEKIQRGTL